MYSKKKIFLNLNLEEKLNGAQCANNNMMIIWIMLDLILIPIMQKTTILLRKLGKLPTFMQINTNKN